MALEANHTKESKFIHRQQICTMPCQAAAMLQLFIVCDLLRLRSFCRTGDYALFLSHDMQVTFQSTLNRVEGYYVV